MLERLLGRAGVPALYREATWDRCSVKAEVEPYILDMPGNVREGRGLILVGAIGTGKSSTAGLIAQHAVQRGLTVRWSYLPDLLGALADRAKVEYLVRLETQPDLLIWDDFAAQRAHPWQVQLLDRITENRYRAHKAMIVTSNLTREGLRNYEEGSRMIDRWRQRSGLVSIAGESVRQTWKDR